MDLGILQEEVREWSTRNFVDQPSYMPLLGVGEEVGELNHAFLKKLQNIRMDESHDENMRDAIGDIIIYLCDFCSRENISLALCIEEAWNVVKQRNWKKVE